jgi:hypothetical protein
MIYPRINEGLIIIKGIKLFYIFILKKLFEFKIQNWFEYFNEFIQTLMNFRSSNPF